MRNLIAATAALCVGLGALPALAKDLIVTVAKPDRLYVIDAAARTVQTDCKLDFNLIPGVIAMSPDNAIAYVLANRWEDVFGIELATCRTVFSAHQSEGDIRRKTIASLAVSKDGTEVYTVRNPVRILPDRYEVLEPEFAVYEAAAGLDAKPARTFPAPRRMTVMATDRSGMVYAGGHEVYAIDPKTGEVSIKIANASWDRPTYSGPDVLAFWPIGSQADEFLLLYSAAVFTDASQSELADFVWGYQTVDLTTGQAKIEDFASFEVIMFSAVRDPNDKSKLYGVYTQLSKHNVDTKELIKRVDLPHTYYCINISSDGRELYVGGTNDDIGVYDSETLERIGEILLPSGGDMAAGTMHVINTGS
ncbi:quinohemoprotein amine dehydrogenase subunit beta [Polymorphum gilvum]|uniref:Quinohemoprotein amine dehydrogenase, beta subunit n=1 Tax=Polymorphum gilvum (strain LMG 25793 / CGMCC 1.9160 / SL003B-26A1) TaxID=991905 RepID=F2J2J6_POLGS|nr:quinohemoprotein amine dehydrogenase subunit beta [Polymorphum gilvum]ADZ70910.1 Quinohemoprotein amine dehydrogenase, beta subunit [Polymorphum gilvum SL003B-26A1]